MFGPNDEIRGVIPRSVEYLFQRLAKKTAICEVAMVCSFLEIYNDQIRDLGKAYLAAMGFQSESSADLRTKTSELFTRIASKRSNPYYAPAFKKHGSNAQLDENDFGPGLKQVMDEYNLMNYEIREDNEGNVFVKDLSLVPVTTMDEVMSLISTGLRVRATHETKMNANSSRSHTVFTITVLQRDKITGEAITGMLNLVDLAGSERLKKSESVGIRLKEALHINTSLTALGKVIMALDPSSEQSHVPYRDSKLTRILQNSLGGNSYTTLIATIHPTSRFYEECLSSLQFANRCRNVRNNPRVNYVDDVEDKDRKIRKLMEEVGTLRSKVNQLSSGNLHDLGSNRSIAGGGGGGGRMTLDMLAKALKKMGIAANVVDGTLLVNGKQYSAESLGLDAASVGGGEDGGGGGSSSSAADRLTSSDAASLTATMNTEKLQRTIKELKESNQNYSMKSKERKAQMEEQGRQLQKLSMEVVKLQTSLKHKEFEVKSLTEEKERSLSEMKAFLEAKYTEELQGVIDTNRDLMKQHRHEIDQVPTALAAYTKIASREMKQKHEVEKPLRKEFDKHVSALEKSRLAEIEAIRKQYEFWLEEKDRALSGFVDSFNAYRTKKSEQLRMAELEIVRLYDYLVQMEEIVNGAEKGNFKFRVKGLIGGPTAFGAGSSKRHGWASRKSSLDEQDVFIDEDGDRAVVEDPLYPGYLVIPRSQRPPKLQVKNSLMKKIVEKHQERTQRLEKMRSEADQKAMHYAAQTDAITRGQDAGVDLRSRVQDLLVSSASGKKTQNDSARPFSAAAGANGSPQRANTTADQRPVTSGGGGGGGGGQRQSGSISPRPPMLSKQNSLQQIKELGRMSRADSFSREPPMSARSTATPPPHMQHQQSYRSLMGGDNDSLEEEKKRLTSSSRKEKRRHTAMDRLNRELLKEVEELRLAAKQRAVSLRSETLHSLFYYYSLPHCDYVSLLLLVLYLFDSYA